MKENPNAIIFTMYNKSIVTMRTKTKLLFQAISRFGIGVMLVGLLLFLPAGTVCFHAAWILMILLFVPMLIAGVVMLLCSPELLERRLAAKEKETEQKHVVALSSLMFIAAFVTAGLDFRFSLTIMPSWVQWSAAVIFLMAYIMYAEVLRENKYLSRTVKVYDNQKVVDTGLYGIVRHPMYSATVLLFLSMPVVLGSLPSLIIMLVYIPIIVKRIRNEEQVLINGLDGYDDYCKKVRYRLIPFVW